MIKTRVLLCTDLDRTLLPNGPQPESPQARPLLRALATQPGITLAYVSGRHQSLIQEAIAEYDIPVPDFVIGDVGTTIYSIKGLSWKAWDSWYARIGQDWHGFTHQQLANLLRHIEELELQEASKQNVYKLSYYAPLDTDRDRLLARIEERLMVHSIDASLIWSIDELAHTGLLDILPRHATKLHAIQYLMQHKHFTVQETVFAGDSGNDLPVLTSELQGILVRNARDEVCEEAQQAAKQNNLHDRLYIARGNFLGMNGNYSAGILEGLAHYFDQVHHWLETQY